MLEQTNLARRVVYKNFRDTIYEQTVKVSGDEVDPRRLIFVRCFIAAQSSHGRAAAERWLEPF